MEDDRLRSVVESLLFVVEGPMTLDRLSSVISGAEKKEIASAIAELQSEFESGGRGLRLVEVAGGFQMRTPKENAEWVRKLFPDKTVRVSRATMETLAVIAYNQPITRAEVENIRGVNADGIVSNLLERRLIRIVARKDVPGRPFLYGTTREFLELFNLKDLSGLPTLKEMEEMTIPQDSEREAPPPESENEAAESEE
jgi:segregation and condensation protein B